jgi:hypothetical protein
MTRSGASRFRPRCAGARLRLAGRLLGVRLMRTTFLRLSFVFAILGAASCLSSAPVDEADPAGETESDVSTSARPDLIACRADAACPRGSYCESGLAACFTGSRCIVEGRPSDAYCERLYGDGFVCFQYAPGSHHCAPTE